MALRRDVDGRDRSRKEKTKGGAGQHTGVTDCIGKATNCVAKGTDEASKKAFVSLFLVNDWVYWFWDGNMMG
jgi:hypothetical protein